MYNLFDVPFRKLITLKLAGNRLLSFPNDRLDILGSLLHLDVSRNHVDHLPIDFPYLYRLTEVHAASNDLLDLPKVRLNCYVFGFGLINITKVPGSF